MPVIPTSPETEVLVQGWGTDPGVGIDSWTPVGGDRGECRLQIPGNWDLLRVTGKEAASPSWLRGLLIA